MGLAICMPSGDEKVWCSFFRWQDALAAYTCLDYLGNFEVFRWVALWGEIWHGETDSTSGFTTIGGARTANIVNFVNFIKFKKANAPQRHIPRAICTKFYVCRQFYLWLTFKFGGFSQGFLEVWRLKLDGGFSPKFAAPTTSETVSDAKKFWHTKLHGHRLLPCEVRWSTDLHAPAEEKRLLLPHVSKVLFLVLSVTFLFLCFFVLLFVCFLFVAEISQELMNWLAPYPQGRRGWSLARTSLNVKVKG